MSKIKIFALGGLNEDGKNMYVTKVDEDIFIFDAGLKYPHDRTLGVEYTICDYRYLKENLKHIKGIFISHGHEANMGAVSDILMEFGNRIPVYGSKFTLEIIKLQLQDDNVQEYKLIELKPHHKIDFGKNSIFPISVNHSIPESLCYVLNTEDGAIVYTGDFIFDPALKGNYAMDIGKLAYVGKQGVLCLMSESLFSSKKGFTSPKHRVSPFIKKVLYENPDRIIINVLPAHIFRIQEIFDEISKTNRKIVIMGSYLQRLINMSIENKYLKINPTKIGSLNDLNDKGIVVLTSDSKQNPFSNLERIIKGNDKYIKLQETDTIFISEGMYEGVEKRMVQIMDDIAKMNIKVLSCNNKEYLLMHPSREDLMLMLNLTNPKYYFPVKGNYKDQYLNAEVAFDCGMEKENIILKQNGDVAEFIDGKLSDEIDHVKVDEILIDGKSQEDIGELVLKDREMLAESGIVIVCATLNKETKEIIAGPEILTRGFIFVKDNIELLQEGQKICTDVIQSVVVPNQRVDFKEITNQIRDNLGRYFYQETEVRPIIITVIQEL